MLFSSVLYVTHLTGERKLFYLKLYLINEKLGYEKNIYLPNTYHMLFVKYIATFRSGVDER
jgi:hypothetical protein